MTISLNHEEQIDYIIDKFNFEKVRCVMLSLDWQWACTESNGHAVPSIARLKAMARHLLRSSIKDTEVTSGGLYATYYPPENGDDDYFVLKFVVATANSVDYNELLRPATSQPSPNSSQVGSSLVDRVSTAIALEDEKHYWPSTEGDARDVVESDMARAAIREVAAWMTSNPDVYFPPALVFALEQEAER